MILLDTCTFLWLTGGKSDLVSSAGKIIQENKGALSVSAVSAFEIGIKVQKGKLALPEKVHDWFGQLLEFHGLEELPITSRIAALSTQLPLIHVDPFDRILVATAIEHRLTILTPDPLIQKYPDVKWAW